MTNKLNNALNCTILTKFLMETCPRTPLIKMLGAMRRPTSHKRDVFQHLLFSEFTPSCLKMDLCSWKPVT